MNNQVSLRDGSLAELEGRGIFGGILVGVRYGMPMSWHSSGRWRWDSKDSPYDIISGLPSLRDLKVIASDSGSHLEHLLSEKGMPCKVARWAAQFLVQRYRNAIGSFVTGEIVFFELSSGQCAHEIHSEAGDFLIGSGGTHWAGEPLPQKTGRTVRFDGIVR